MKIKELSLGLALGFVIGVYVQTQTAGAVMAGSKPTVQDAVSFTLANAQGDALYCGINPKTFIASSSGTAIMYIPPAGKKATLSLVLNGLEIDE